MNEQALRETICEIGRRLWQIGMAPANAGNLSARLDAERVLCTPTGVSKGMMAPEDLVVLDMDGNTLGPGKVTSEAQLHLTCYRRRPEVGGVVHVHPPIATAFACTRHRLPVELLTEAVCLLGEVPTAAPAPPGSPGIPAALAPYLDHAVAFLLANHGALTLGRDVWEAFHRMEVLEHAAQVALAAHQLGEVSALPEDVLGVLERPD